MIRSVILLAFLLVLCSCTRDAMKMLEHGSFKKVNLTSELLKTHDFSTTTQSDQQVKVTYLGSGGCYIGTKKGGVLIDPFFSHQPFWILPFIKIGTDEEAVATGLQSIQEDIKNVEGVFVSHAHYDHLMDVPFVFNHYLDTTNAALKIHGSKSMKAIARQVVTPSKLEVLDSYLSDVDRIGRWVYLADSSMRVLPIKTEHAPHYKKIIPVSLYKGEAKPIKKYQSDLDKTRAAQWKGGETYSFLIDVMNKDVIEARLFIQSSSAAPPNGFVHADILKEHAINLAILGTASFNNVKDYPVGIVAHLQPEKIMLCHWEDFFLPYENQPKRLVRTTNIRKFILKLNQVYPWRGQEEKQFFMLNPGVTWILGD